MRTDSDTEDWHARGGVSFLSRLEVRGACPHFDLPQCQLGTGTAQSATYASSYAAARVPVPGYVPRYPTAPTSRKAATPLSVDTRSNCSN
ncbi:MAG: hypothetical protein JWP59_548 [Massilia sp.]|nr:hypothetical protein [Massilia sp.]